MKDRSSSRTSSASTHALGPDTSSRSRRTPHIERVVLARAVQWHLADRVIAHHGLDGRLLGAGRRTRPDDRPVKSLIRHRPRSGTGSRLRPVQPLGRGLRRRRRGDRRGGRREDDAVSQLRLEGRADRRSSSAARSAGRGLAEGRGRSAAATTPTRAAAGDLRRLRRVVRARRLRGLRVHQRHARARRPRRARSRRRSVAAP